MACDRGAERYDEGEVPGLPVRLRAIPTPGHTGGHCSLLAEDHGVLFAGDALRNVDFFTREPGVGVLPFNEDTACAEESLANLEAVAAELVAFGHGDPVAAPRGLAAIHH